MDLGGPTSYYAAKSFADTVNNRRLVWAWVRLGEQALEAVDEEGDKIAGFHGGGCRGIGIVRTNTNSMAREITYDPQLQTLNFFPVSEMAALRRKVRNTHLLRHFIFVYKKDHFAKTGSGQTEGKLNKSGVFRRCSAVRLQALSSRRKSRSRWRLKPA